MKSAAFFIFSGCWLVSINTFAQTPKQIEADLLKSFKRIDYCDEKRYKNKTYHIEYEDSLNNANKAFGKKLKYFAEKCPATIMQSFALLKKEHLVISTSSNGLFRIYSWDTEEGGTMHSFENVFQYKLGDKTLAVLDTPKEEGDFRTTYTKILTIASNKQRYYIANFLFLESSRYYDEGVRIFTIENGKLNDHFNALKTKSGLHSQINYEYDLNSVADINKIPSIIFDPTLETIKFPIVDDKGRFTHGHITYKFTGKYFEKVSS